jgi:hypothetical protein
VVAKFYNFKDIYNKLLEYTKFLNRIPSSSEINNHDGNGNYYIKQNLKIQQEHDKRKKKYAKDNKIDLLEIWYWEFDNIESILDNVLNN